MTLYLDLTTNDRLILGLRSGANSEVRSLALPAFRHDGVLRALEVFLRRSHAEPSAVRSLVVVSGPGRFSSLRVSATIANLFSWFGGCALYTVRGEIQGPKATVEYLDALDARKKHVKHVHPYYGRPPSITKPKKKYRAAY